MMYWSKGSIHGMEHSILALISTRDKKQSDLLT